MAALTLECAVRSDVGRRQNNEDAVFASAKLAAVADGVGGAVAGEVASSCVIQALIHLDKCRLEERLEDALLDAVACGNDRIGFVAECRPHMTGMSTTLTAVALSNEGEYVVANVGDSRTYLLRDGVLTRLTRDDSFMQELLDRGQITAEQARRHPQRSLVLRALDGRPERTPAMTTVAARSGDRLLLCSDGLSDVIDDDVLANALEARSSARDCADRLVELALHAGARDNVSVIVADVVPRRDPAAAWQPPLAVAG
jgi:PPM family protein phosphatase